MAIRARWKGKDPEAVDLEYISGIPARSLEEAEYDALDAEQKKAVQDSPLYDVRPAREAAAARAEPAAAEAEPESKG